MAKQVDVIKKFVDVLTKTSTTGTVTAGTAAVDAAMKAVGAGNYSAFLSKFNSEVHNQTDLEQICGVRINNKDTGAITGSDAGGSTTKTAESIIPEKAAAKELTNAEYESFTKNGLTVNVVYDTSDGGSDFNYDEDTYLAKQKLAVRALYNWWIPESLDLINESLGINFTDGRANTNEITVKFSQDSRNLIEIDTDYDLGRADSVTLTISSNLIKGLTASDKSGTISGSKGYVNFPSSAYLDSYQSNYAYADYVDQLVLQALSKVALDANISYVNSLPQYINCGLTEIVGGFDAAPNNHFLYTNSKQCYGYTLLRYLAKNYTVDTLPAGLSYNADKTVLTASTAFTGSKIELSDFAESVKTVNASVLTKAVKITGNALNNSIVGGKGADTLAGASGNDSLTGGAGDDIFIYSAGKDFITDYAVGDKISIASGTLSKASLSGSDVVLTIGSGSLTVKNAKDKKITWIDTAGKEASTLLGGSTTSTTLKITNATKSPVTLAKTYKHADASSRTTAIKITGNTEANSIIGGKGNDTLWGGTGNDTLKGGNGNDVFIYSDGEGKDIIYGFANDDMLLITGAFTGTYDSSKKEVAFKVGSTASAVTLKNFTATTFNVNGYDYGISGTKFVKK